MEAPILLLATGAIYPRYASDNSQPRVGLQQF